MNLPETFTQGNPITRRVALFFAMLIMAVAVVVSVPTSAHAAQDHGGVGGLKTPSLCGTAGDEVGVDYLPVFRWSSATGNMHTRYSKLDLSGVMGGFTDRAVTNISFGLGNAMWNATTSMVTLANRACPIDAVGGMVDKYAGKLGRAVIDSGIVVVFVVAGLLGVVWRGYRNAGSFRFATLMPKIMVLGLLLIMINGAAQSTGGGIDGSGKQYKPGLGSPGWVATTIDEVVSSLAQAPVSVMMNEDTFAIGGLAATTDNTKSKNSGSDYSTSCRYYVKSLHDLYKSQNKKAFVDVTGTSRALSSMWEQSGLRAWREVQFGDKSTAGNRMYCYALESMRDIPVTKANKDAAGTMAQIMAAAKMGAPKADMPVFARTSDTATFDKQMVALAQCRITNGNVAAPEFSIYQLTAKDSGKTRPTAQDCKDAFTAGKQMPPVFDWPPRENKGLIDSVKDSGGSANGAVAGMLAGNDVVDKYAIPGSQKDFLKSLHGGGGGGGSMLTGIFYMASSFFVMISFGILSAAILLAKMAALVFLFMFIVVAIGYMLPNADPGKFPRLFKQYAGLSFFIFGFQLVMAILAFLTKILVDMGTETIDNSQMEMLWVGMAPALALLAMHLSFKKMGMPSPLSVNAGQAWGKAAGNGSIGGAAMTAGAAGLGGYLGNRFGMGALQSAVGNTIADKFEAARGSKGTKEKSNTERPGAMKGVDLNKFDTERLADEVKGGDGASVTDDLERGSDSMQEWEGKSGLFSAESAAAARKEAKENQTGFQRATAPVVNRWNDGVKALQNWQSAPFKTTAKGVAKTLPLAGLGAAGVAAVAVGGAPIAAVAGAAGMAFAAKKGVSAAATQMGMDTKANRRAFESNAKRRADAIRQAREVEAAKAERERAAEAQQEMLGRAYDSAQNGSGAASDATATVPAEPSTPVRDKQAEIDAAWEEFERDRGGVERFVEAAHQHRNGTTGPTAPTGNGAII